MPTIKATIDDDGWLREELWRMTIHQAITKASTLVRDERTGERVIYLTLNGKPLYEIRNRNKMNVGRMIICGI